MKKTAAILIGILACGCNLYATHMIPPDLVGYVKTNGNAIDLTNFPALVVLTNNSTYTATVAKAASALQSESESLWTAQSNNVVYTNSSTYTATVAKAASALQSESSWAAASNTVVYTNNTTFLTITTNASKIGAGTTPTNYTATSTDVQGNLVGIDGALGAFVVSTNIIVTGSDGGQGVLGVYTPTNSYNSSNSWYSTNGNYIFFTTVDWSIFTNRSSTDAYYAFYRSGVPVGHYSGVNGNVTGAYSYIWSSLFTASEKAIATNSYPNASGVAASNLAASALSTNGGTMGGNINLNAETISNGVIAGTSYSGGGIVTNPINANINLNGNTISNGVVSASSLQVTGGSPTNGAVWIATNTVGQGKWSYPVAFQATIVSSDFTFQNSATTVIWNNIVINCGNAFNGTNFVAPVKGIYQFIWMGEWWKVTGAPNFCEFSFYSSGSQVQHSYWPYFSAGLGGGPYVLNSGNVYLTNGATWYCVVIPGAYTNRLGCGAEQVFSGSLIRELP